MSEQLAKSTAELPIVRASSQLASFIGMEADAMCDTIKAQCFKCPPQNVTDAQLSAFISIAVEMKVNPLLPGMLYAFPIQGGGIVPMMGPDAVFKKLAEHSEVESWETEVLPAEVDKPATHAVTRIYRKGRERPLSYTALLSEWKVGSNPNWNSRPRHMLGLRSLKQCARQIIHGIPFDEDERVIMGEVNVTNTADSALSEAPVAPIRPKVERAKKGAAAALETTAEPAKPAEEPKAAAPAPAAQTPRQAEISKASASAVDAELDATPRQPLTALADKQVVTVTCEVTEMVCKDFSTTPGKPKLAVRAILKGEFNGSVYDMAVTSENGKLKHNDAWTIDGLKKLVLSGKARQDKTVAVMVESIVDVTPAAAGGEVP